MAEEPGGAEERRWLQPPEPGEVRIDIAVDEEAELTPEVRSALDRLARLLEEGEVQGYAKPSDCPAYVAPPQCSGYVHCPKDGRCRPKTRVPGCAKVYGTCRIIG